VVLRHVLKVEIVQLGDRPQEGERLMQPLGVFAG
jgi:hypothetical protein